MRKYGISLTGSGMNDKGMQNKVGEALREVSQLSVSVIAGLDRFNEYHSQQSISTVQSAW